MSCGVLCLRRRVFGQCSGPLRRGWYRSHARDGDHHLQRSTSVLLHRCTPTAVPSGFGSYRFGPSRCMEIGRGRSGMAQQRPSTLRCLSNHQLTGDRGDSEWGRGHWDLKRVTFLFNQSLRSINQPRSCCPHPFNGHCLVIVWHHAW
jgi:hypothetical protein